MPVGQGLGHLPDPICSEVETDHDIAILDSTDRRAVSLTQHHGHHEFIRDAFTVRTLNRFYCVGSLTPLPIHQRLIGFFCTLPALIAIHTIIPSHDCRHCTDTPTLHGLLEGRHIVDGTLGRSIAAIKTRMHKYTGESIGL